MTKSEAQTRQFIINQRLKLSGWEVKNPLYVTEELDIWVGLPAGVAEPQTPYQGHIFADYVLLGKDGKPLAVVEAKKTSIDAEIGKEQARNYAQKIHETTGAPMPFVFYTNGYDIYFWDTERFPPRKILGYPSRSDLERMQFLRDNSKPLSSQLVDTRISGRPYQIGGEKAPAGCEVDSNQDSRETQCGESGQGNAGLFAVPAKQPKQRENGLPHQNVHEDYIQGHLYSKQRDRQGRD
jgi:type I restriction enzyme R subunit